MKIQKAFSRIRLDLGHTKKKQQTSSMNSHSVEHAEQSCERKANGKHRLHLDLHTQTYSLTVMVKQVETHKLTGSQFHLCHYCHKKFNSCVFLLLLFFINKIFYKVLLKISNTESLRCYILEAQLYMYVRCYVTHAYECYAS